MERQSDSKRDTSVIFPVPPYYYLHVLDQTTNVTRIEIGPQTYIRKDNEKVILPPTVMVIVPPRHYCVIENPVQRNVNKEVILDKNGQIKLHYAELEAREVVKFPVTPLRVVETDCALRLKAIRDFTDDEGNSRVAGDQWLFEGPGTYIPRKEVVVVEQVKARVILPNQAIRLRATRACKDRDGNDRCTGEEWIVKKEGAYLPGVYEEVIEITTAHVLTDTKAIAVRATKTFKDDLGVTRKNGDEWLVRNTDTETYILGVNETFLDTVKLTTLTSRQYCVILNPIGSDGRPQYGQRKLVKGEKSFFLHPGEELENTDRTRDGIQEIYVLSDVQGLVVRASEAFTDEAGKAHQPGDRWMIRGPAEYVPPVEVEVLVEREAIPLDQNEGVYVRDIKTGKVRAVIGETYLLNQDEELWEKPLPEKVESILAQDKDVLADRGQWFRKQNRGDRECDDETKRDKTRVVTFRISHNTACQVYDYKEKKARVIFGPDLVLLGPDEMFTQLSLSAGKPKRPNQIRALGLLLGPDFMSDIITVETSDHARLSLQLSYNWHFDISEIGTSADKHPPTAVFSVPDFVGDTCKALASRIRGAVAGVPFDDFHKHSALIINKAVFGVDEKGEIRNRFVLQQNRLSVTSVDIQSVEPVDQRTRDSLQKSVQLAIEITTNSQEAAARHEAERVEQEAKGKLERQRIMDEAQAEKTRKDLLELQAESAAVESCGQATAEAKSRSEAAKIEGEMAVQQAKLKAEAMRIEAEAELDRLSQARRAELEYKKSLNELEITKEKEVADIEKQKFNAMVEAIGQETLQKMATAGPDHQVRLLQSLGLQSTLITDGRTPINLLNTAQGLLGGGFLKDTPGPSSKKSRMVEDTPE
ncbi:unnamed protein product [Cyprideis torosa]|uniref:Major vault protein n=1 Tax=Cyprideis torosa TaxID=163714 RepID=A0A7R8W8Y0_9CRUS|nr:unnamed protein product [Cyprideis torosa]CAG0889129.1 unnamed protein product [Cyprideis torosa]